MQSQEIEIIVEQALGAAVPLFETVLKDTAESIANEAIKAGAVAGAKAALKAIEGERKKGVKARYDRRLHNTKLLLRNYRMLMEHYMNAVYEGSYAKEEAAEFADIMELMSNYASDEEVYVESIKKSAARTAIIMEHINKMLGIYAVYCERSEREERRRHYRVINAVFLAEEPTTVAEVAREENVDKRTVYKDIDAACETLTSLIFGIDGIKR